MNRTTASNILTIIITLICAIIVGSILLYWHRQNVAAIVFERDALMEQVSELQNGIAHLQQLVMYNKESDSLRKELNRLTRLCTDVDKKVAGRLPKIYMYNSEFHCDGIGYYIFIYTQLSILEKMRVIAGVLSKYHFSGHPINVTRIEQRNGKMIAAIDLKESGKERVYTWKGGYFQGSSGGWETSLVLVNTFLQPDYMGEWVDGVEFRYEGEAIKAGEWDHIFLSGTKYREKK